MERVSGRLFSAGWAALGRHSFDLRGQQKVTVIVRFRSWEAWPQIGNRPTGMVVVQPVSCDTGAEFQFISDERRLPP